MLRGAGGRLGTTSLPSFLSPDGGRRLGPGCHQPSTHTHTHTVVEWLKVRVVAAAVVVLE